MTQGLHITTTRRKVEWILEHRELWADAHAIFAGMQQAGLFSAGTRFQCVRVDLLLELAKRGGLEMSPREIAREIVHRAGRHPSTLIELITAAIERARNGEME